MQQNFPNQPGKFMLEPYNIPTDVYYKKVKLRQSEI